LRGYPIINFRSGNSSISSISEPSPCQGHGSRLQRFQKCPTHHKPFQPIHCFDSFSYLGRHPGLTTVRLLFLLRASDLSRQPLHASRARSSSLVSSLPCLVPARLTSCSSSQQHLGTRHVVSSGTMAAYLRFYWISPACPDVASDSSFLLVAICSQTVDRGEIPRTLSCC